MLGKVTLVGVEQIGEHPIYLAPATAFGIGSHDLGHAPDCAIGLQPLLKL